MLIDTHCHLNFPDKFPDVAATVEQAKLNGVDKLIVVGCDTQSSRRAVELADQFDSIFAVVGWHPTYTKDFTQESLGEIQELLDHPKVVAIGEIGLDFHWDYATPEQQRVALDAQLDLADRSGLPVVFHARDAYPQLLDILEARPILPYLFHCFAGDSVDAQRALNLGSMFGVDGPISYKNAGSLREVIQSLPKDRIVIETDSPYLTPEPHRGKPNQPAHVKFVNEALAKTLQIPVVECARMTTENAERFFRLN